MKRFLLLFVALIAMAGLHAQSYNVVITTSNGTTIALSANDINNISFNNGQLVVNGTDIAKLATTTKLDSLEKAYQQDLNMLMAAVNDLYYRSDRMTQAVQDSIEALKQMLGVDTVDVSAAVAEVKQQIETYKAQIEENRAYMQMLASELDAVMQQYETQEKEIVTLQADNTVLKEQIATLQADIENLKAVIANLEAALDNHINSTTTNQ